MHDEEVLGKAYDARLMRRLIGYLRPYRKQVLAALLLLVNAMIPKPGETRMSGGGTQVMLRRSVTEPAGWSPAGRAIRFAS